MSKRGQGARLSGRGISTGVASITEVKPVSVMRWLLDSDPAIRWQTMRDLSDEPADRVRTERARVAVDGWGAALLALQSPHGYWGPADDEGWMTTMDALVLLKDLGIDPAHAAVRTAVGRVRDRLTWWQLDGRPYFAGETEPCINGRILGTGAYFGAAHATLVDRLLDEQLADGGWNCEAPPSTRSSFNTTICVLEGLLAYERATGATPAITQSRHRAHEYLLERHLLRSLRSGKIVDRRWTRFAFPTIWHYDVLRALDYLRDAGVVPDDRMREAIGEVEKRRHQNGRWPMNHLHERRLAFDMEIAVGSASRWNTLRAMRVLRWHEMHSATG